MPAYLLYPYGWVCLRDLMAVAIPVGMTVTLAIMRTAGYSLTIYKNVNDMFDKLGS